MSQNKKIHIAVLFGGKSAEHEVSVNSARNVVAALDPNKYQVSLIGIDKIGVWHLQQMQDLLSHQSELSNLNSATTLSLALGKAGEFLAGNQIGHLQSIDVIFPVLHGPLGEDGTVQGLLRLADIPFVGSDVLSSAINMDKDVMKRLLIASKLPTGKFLVYRHHELAQIDFTTITKQLGLPLFIKPANLGSSIGVSKVHNAVEFHAAIADAFAYDRKIIIEEFIAGREIECAVLGNETMVASLPSEVIPQHEFYSYEAKYLDPNGACFELPAKLSPELTKRVQQLAIATAQALCCEGMARVDFFITADETIYINEVNTIPGFTAISQYPSMWLASGLSYPHLIDRLIELALEKYQANAKLKHTPDKQ